MTPIFGLALLVLWFLFFWVYRDYRIDAYRQRLFAVRDELWDLAAEGEIAFDHPAHRIVRARLNGLIRFAHLLSITWIILVMVARAFRPAPEIEAAARRELIAALAAAPSPTVADRLRDLHARALALAIEHVLMISPLFWLFVVPGIALIIIRRVWKQWADYVRRLPGRDLVDSEAARLGALA